jgi:hypothetical protein
MVEVTPPTMMSIKSEFPLVVCKLQVHQLIEKPMNK